MICVQNTFFAYYFDKTGDDTVFLLSEAEAEKAWRAEIHAESTSYFNIPDKSWLVTTQSESLGRWEDAYNGDDNAVVEEILRGAIDWNDDDIVKFFVNIKTVFQTTWRDFLRLWDEFLAVDDDCPIVVPEGGSGKEAIIFTPMGEIIKVG